MSWLGPFRLRRAHSRLDEELPELSREESASGGDAGWVKAPMCLQEMLALVVKSRHGRKRTIEEGCMVTHRAILVRSLVPM